MPALWTDPREPIVDDRPTVLDGPIGLVVAIALGAAFFVFAPGAVRTEQANDQQQLQLHQQRLEQERPGAIARVIALAREHLRR